MTLGVTVMTKFDHIEPPTQFQYRKGQVLIKNFLNSLVIIVFILQIQCIKT